MGGRKDEFDVTSQSLFPWGHHFYASIVILFFLLMTYLDGFLNIESPLHFGINPDPGPAPGQVAQLVGVSSCTPKGCGFNCGFLIRAQTWAAGSILCQGAYGRQPVDVFLSSDVSLSLPTHLLSKHILGWKFLRKLWYIYTMEYYLAIKKKGSLPFWDSMDGPGEYYAKWNEPVRERQIPYDLTYM